MNESETVALAFNDCINRGDLAGLSALMSDDHVFIDSAGARVPGKASCLKAWEGFFSAFPDYRNHFERTRVDGGRVAVSGRSTCSDARLQGPALWSAEVRGGLVSERRVYKDTPSERARLGFKAAG